MTDEQLPYSKCVMKKSLQLYSLFFTMAFDIFKIVVIFCILLGGLGSLRYIIYQLWLNWHLVTEKLPPIPAIPWYVYVLIAGLLIPLVYSAVWCIFKREAKS
jgi:hypothetical protein